MKLFKRKKEKPPFPVYIRVILHRKYDNGEPAIQVLPITGSLDVNVELQGFVSPNPGHFFLRGGDSLTIRTGINVENEGEAL